MVMTVNACDKVQRDKFDPPKGKSNHAVIKFESSERRAWLRYEITGSHKEELPHDLYWLIEYGTIDIFYGEKEKLLIKAWAEIDRGNRPENNNPWISCKIYVEDKLVASDSTTDVTALTQEIFCRART